jgi:NitT/TauT family transport system ATP-binding protein
VVLGRHGVVAEHRIDHPRDPERPPAAEQRGEILAALSRTESLAPVGSRTDPRKDVA